jgi:hypothetical protein
MKDFKNHHRKSNSYHQNKFGKKLHRHHQSKGKSKRFGENESIKLMIPKKVSLIFKSIWLFIKINK